MKSLLDHMAGHRSTALRRHLFDRLWPLAQSRTLPASWADVTPSDVVHPLVRTAPKPDPIALVFDAVTERDWSHALLDAIRLRPHPHLVPALERWSNAHPTRQDQLRVQAALTACRTARPW